MCQPVLPYAIFCRLHISCQGKQFFPIIMMQCLQLRVISCKQNQHLLRKSESPSKSAVLICQACHIDLKSSAWCFLLDHCSKVSWHCHVLINHLMFIKTSSASFSVSSDTKILHRNFCELCFLVSGMWRKALPAVFKSRSCSQSPQWK